MTLPCPPVGQGAIGQQHIGNRAPILVRAVGLKRNFFPKDQGGGSLLRLVAVSLGRSWPTPSGYTGCQPYKDLWSSWGCRGWR